MNDSTGRMVGWTGVVSTVGLIAGASIFGSAPKADDSAAKTLAYTVSHRGRLLLGMGVLSLASVLTLAFVVGLWVVVRSRGSVAEVWSSIALATGIGVFTLAAASFAFVSAAAYRSDTIGAETARSMWDLYLAMLNASNIMTVVTSVAFAFAILAHDALPRWVGWTSGIVAIAHVVSSLCWARSGAFSPTGPLALLSGFAFLAWMLAVSVTLLRGQAGVP